MQTVPRFLTNDAEEFRIQLYLQKLIWRVSYCSVIEVIYLGNFEYGGR